MKVMVVMGTRPEVIKMAPVVVALRAASIQTVVCTTGQHREMLAQAMAVFSLQADVVLDLMQPGQTLNGLAARLLTELDPVLVDEQPDWVLVQGDTTTAFCAGLAAFYRGIRVGHVEAGLRTGELASPFPEEANRSLLARLATWHFAPTQFAAQALLAEGIRQDAICVTGNTIVDAIHQACAGWNGSAPPNLPEPVRRLGGSQGSFVLVTCHRRENFGGILEGICQMLLRLSQAYPELQWIFPVHLNPGVREPVMRILNGQPNIHLIEPVDYHTSLYLISQARLVVSDSGGIQEEAPTFGTPVVVMRRHTERMEGVAAGFATLAGQEPSSIEAAIHRWLQDPEGSKALRGRANPYGDGHAANRIVAILTGQMVSEFHG